MEAWPAAVTELINAIAAAQCLEFARKPGLFLTQRPTRTCHEGTPAVLPRRCEDEHRGQDQNACRLGEHVDADPRALLA